MDGDAERFDKSTYPERNMRGQFEAAFFGNAVER